MKIYTKKGDTGQTSLLSGNRVPKHHIRIECYGTVDELNAYIGLLHAQTAATSYRDILRSIQHTLFVLGSNLAADTPAARERVPQLGQESITLLEESIDSMTDILPPLRNFILPGGHPANGLAHLARCVCRRAERNVVALSENESVDPLILTYLNRLSDWLFVFARMLSKITESTEVIWKP